MVSSAIHSWPHDLDLPLKLSTDLVKTLVLNISISRKLNFKWSHPDGKNESLPTSIIYSNVRLVEANITATVSLKESSDNDSFIQSATFEIIKYLKHVAPNVCDLKVDCEEILTGPRGRNYWRPIGACLGLLVTNVAKRKLDICYGWVMGAVDIGSINYAGPLTHIRIIGWKYEWTIELIRRCAGTLQVIDLDRGMSIANISNIIVDGEGNYLVYPNLRQLLIRRDSSNAADSPLSPFPGAVPFPNLRRFWCLESYFFKDDVVFRGNQGTLEDLNLYLYTEEVNNILRGNEFSATSHPNLQRVVTSLEIATEDDYDSNAFAKLMYEIGKNAWDLKLNVINNRWSFQPEVFSPYLILEQHQLRKLSFESYRLDIADIIQLLGSLPNLVEFTTCFKPMDDSQLIQQLVDKHYPLGPKLVKLSVSLCSSEYEAGCLKPMVAVILLCPNVVILQQVFGIKALEFYWSLINMALSLGVREYVKRIKTLKVVEVGNQ